MSMSKLRRSAGLAFAIVIALGTAAGAARAEGEGNGDPFGLENSHLAVSLPPVGGHTGSTGYRSDGLGSSIPVVVGAVAPADGSQGEPDPLNSLSSAPEIGG